MACMNWRASESDSVVGTARTSLIIQIYCTRTGGRKSHHSRWCIAMIYNACTWNQSTAGETGAMTWTHGCIQWRASDEAVHPHQNFCFFLWLQKGVVPIIMYLKIDQESCEKLSKMKHRVLPFLPFATSRQSKRVKFTSIYYNYIRGLWLTVMDRFSNSECRNFSYPLDNHTNGEIPDAHHMLYIEASNYVTL